MPPLFRNGFFSQSLEAPFIYHSILTDIGMVQLTGLEENIPATAAALDTFYPLTRSKIEACAAFFSQCRMVICDIAPLGILAAKQAKIPSILVENFTWDWIYAAYEQKSASLRSHIDYLDHLFQQADFHVQTEPVCLSIGCDCRVPPVARSIKASAPALRSRFSPRQRQTGTCYHGRYESGFLFLGRGTGQKRVLVCRHGQ